MTLEDVIDDLVDAIGEVTELKSYRSDNDMEVGDDDDSDEFISVSVLDTGKKKLLSIDNFISKRDNPLYSNYGYLNVYRVIYRVMTYTRANSRQYATEIENYLKTNFNIIHNDIVIKRNTFSGQKEFVISDVVRLYGIETNFEFTIANIWDDEPTEGALSQTDVDVIEIIEDTKMRIVYNGE